MRRLSTLLLLPLTLFGSVTLTHPGTHTHTFSSIVHFDGTTYIKWLLVGTRKMATKEKKKNIDIYIKRILGNIQSKHQRVHWKYFSIEIPSTWNGNRIVHSTALCTQPNIIICHCQQSHAQRIENIFEVNIPYLDTFHYHIFFVFL